MQSALRNVDETAVLLSEVNTLTDKPRLLLFCFSVLFHMYEALKQTQNKKIVLFWVCFGFVSRRFVSVVVRAALDE